MSQPVTDIRSFPTRVMNMYLYPIAGWGLLLAGFFVGGVPEAGLPACYLLALWLGGLTAWWGWDVNKRMKAGELSRLEIDAGVVSIGHILSGAAAMPAIVFLTNDPLSASSWSTAVGTGVVCFLVWLGVNQLVKVSRWYTGALALGLAWFALPMNTTGAVTAAMMIGWYDQTIEDLGLPEELQLNLDAE